MGSGVRFRVGIALSAIGEGLREAARDFGGASLRCVCLPLSPAGSGHPPHRFITPSKYHLFDALACKAAYIISEGEPSVPPRWVLRPLKRKTELDLQAINQLQSIKQGGHEAWEEAVQSNKQGGHEAWEEAVSNFVNGVSAKHTDSRPCPETAAWHDGSLMESESP